MTRAELQTGLKVKVNTSLTSLSIPDFEGEILGWTPDRKEIYLLPENDQPVFVSITACQLF